MKYIAAANIVLLEALSSICPDSSKTTLRSWIKEGRVKIDGELGLTANTLVIAGQTVTIGNRKRFLPGDIAILYEDADLVVIDKPSGLLSVATTFDKTQTAHAILKQHYPNKKVQVVHRIDQDTSGVMMFALSQEAYDKLKKDFEIHAIERAYTAIVEGKMVSSSGTWNSLLYEDANYVVHMTDDPSKGKQAITHYTVKNRSKFFSWLELNLETGRKNQIRVHCQVAGHPIVGDKKYGSSTNPIKRLCLHAHLLGFTHPITHKKLSFTSLPPREFYRIISPEGIL
jgi:23S rRNA pseudouridine1911/1915/1917 synthase